jgi:hypothetical protein
MINALFKILHSLRRRNVGEKRLAACVPNNTFMEYVDSLAVSVKTKKLTEAEATRRYTEYKSGGMR